MLRKYIYLIIVFLFINGLNAQSIIIPSTYDSTISVGFNTKQYEAWLYKRVVNKALQKLPFRLLKPKAYDSLRITKYPLIIVLHGRNEHGTDNQFHLKWGAKGHQDAVNMLYGVTFPGFVMFPQEPYGQWTNTPIFCTTQPSSALSMVFDLVDSLKLKYNIDPNRIYIHGLSSGGTGTWAALYHRPDLFAAGLPMSAPGDTTQALKICTVPFWLFQGGKDTNPNPRISHQMMAAVRAAGGRDTNLIRFTEYPNLAHSTWFTAYANRDFFPYMLRQSKLNLMVLDKDPTCPGSKIALVISPGFHAYQWYFNTISNAIHGANTNMINVSISGNYFIAFKRTAASNWEYSGSKNVNAGALSYDSTVSYNDTVNYKNAGVLNIPPGYYNSVGTLSGADLKTALYNIIKGHAAQSYSDLWVDFQSTDARPNGKVWELYGNCDFSFGNYPTGNQDIGTFGCSECQVYTREYLMPLNWFGNYVPSAGIPPSTDLFNVIPADKNAGNMRNDYPYGEVGMAIKTFSSGSKFGQNTFPGFSGNVFEPIDEYKGDFARSYLYMATRYENVIAGWDTLSTEGSNVLNGTIFPAYKSWYIDLLAKWHEKDPVSPKEINRNKAVYAIQGNRNPYIDHPEYAGRVWGFDVTTVNSAPIAYDATFSGILTITGRIDDYYSDPNYDVLTVSSFVGNTSNGFLLLKNDGSFIYLPATTFSGIDNYTYSVCDYSTCTSAIIYFAVKRIIEQPSALNGTFTGSQIHPFTGTIIHLVDDPANLPLTINTYNDTLSHGGSLVLNSDGWFNYTPKASFSGVESYTYTVCNASTCTSAIIYFEVTLVIPPVALNGTFSGSQFNIFTGNITNFISDPSNIPLTVIAYNDSLSYGGLLFLSEDGAFNYTPKASFSGVESYTYTVCNNATCTSAIIYFLVVPLLPPIALNATFTGNKFDSISGSITNLISDPANLSLTLITFDGALLSGGSMVLNSDGSFSYTAQSDFIGIESYNYTVCNISTCTSAIIYFSITPVASPGTPPIALGTTFTGSKFQPLIGSLEGMYSDPAGLPLVVTTFNGTLLQGGSFILNSEGSFSYIPEPSFSGVESYIYTVCNTLTCSSAMIYFAVSQVAPPVALNATFTGSRIAGSLDDLYSDPSSLSLTVFVHNDTLSHGGLLVLDSDGLFRYTSKIGFSGIESYTYTVCNAWNCTSAMIYFSVTQYIAPPVAMNGTFTGSIITGSLSGLYSDPANLPLSTTMYNDTLAHGGSLVLNSDGSFNYRSKVHFSGLESYLYTVCNISTCTSAIVYFSVPKVAAPVAMNGTFTGGKFHMLEGSISHLYRDPVNFPLSVIPFNETLSHGGWLVLDAGGSFSYAPKNDFSGIESHIYTVCNTSTCSSGIITFNITTSSVLSIESDLKFYTIDVYPNPVSDYLNFKISKGKSGESGFLQVFDELGICRYSTSYTPDVENRFSVSGLVPGFYFLKVYKGASLYWGKFIVKK